MKTQVGQSYNCASNARGFQHWGYATKRSDGLYDFTSDAGESRVLKPCQIRIVGKDLRDVFVAPGSKTERK